MAILVRFQVPVLARVDLVSRRVTSVHVEDESVGDACDVIVVDEPNLSAADRERAIAVAAETIWPAWNVG